MNAHDICRTAATLVGNDRGRAYGDKEVNFTKIAILWNAYIQTRRDLDSPFNALDVGIMMALLKIARTQSGRGDTDNWIDGAGYLACAGELDTKDQVSLKE